jgi:excisionase family DNA binding protein
MTEKLLKAIDVAELLGVRPKTIYTWASIGKLPTVDLPGRGVRFSPRQLALWQRQQSRGLINEPPTGGNR